MQRYFTLKDENDFILSDLDKHHLINVMRSKLGDQVILINNSKEYLCKIISLSPLHFEIVEELHNQSELKKEVTLYYCLAKGDKIDFVVQKACELGVSKIVLIRSEHCVVKMDQDSFNKKIARYNLIIKEACEQSHRLILPKIYGVYDITKIPEDLKMKVNFVADECCAGSTSNLSNYLSNESFGVLIGAEGGLSRKEVDELNKQGFISVSFGHRILRTETAAVYALSVLSYLLEK